MIELAEIESARGGSPAPRCAPRSYACITSGSRAGTEIYLKLELLQPINSFKIRGATNAILPGARVRARQGPGHGERGQHGAGRRVGRP